MSSRQRPPNGYTLIEMVVTMVLFAVMAGVGSLLIGKLAPSYLVGAQAEQALTPREAALWRLSEDFRKSLLDETNQSACTLNLYVVSDVTGTMSEIVTTQPVSYVWFSASQQLWVSDARISGVLLDHVETCPFTYASGIERSRLNLKFSYKNGDVTMPVSTTLYSYVNGPYVASAVLGGGAVSSVAVSGVFPGVSGGGIYSIVFLSGTTPVSATVTGATSTSIVANISSVASAVVDVTVATPEGKNTLKKAFTFP